MKVAGNANSLRVIVGLLISVCGGLAFILAFPPYEIWPLIFIGFVPVLIAQHRIMPPRLSSLATAVAIAIWLQGYLGPVFAPIGNYMVWLPLIALIICFFTDRGQREFHKKTGYRWFVISGIITWAAIEMIRLFLPVAGTWAFVAYPLYKQLWLIQPASIFGIIGTGMLVMLVNHVLALQVIHILDNKRWINDYGHDSKAIVNKKLTIGWLKKGVLLTAAWLALSLFQLNSQSEAPKIKAAAVQPAVSPIMISNAGENKIPVLERMAEQTINAADRGAQFIVWPEGALDRDPRDGDYPDLAELAVETSAYLATGYIVNQGAEGFRNEATVIDPEGNFLGVFGKDHPVVFGGETSLSRGSYPVYETSIGNLATIICYDLDYTDTTRKMVSGGAQLIGVPSNDWGSIADKHYTHVVFRAVENRVAMVKADGGFNSALVDPYGKIIDLAVFPDGGEATLVGDLQLGDGKGTFTTKFGDWLGWIALAGLAFFTFGGRWLEKKAKC